MKGSIQIAKLFDIPVQLHWTFGLLFFWVIYIGNSEGMNVTEILWLAAFVLAVFVCVVLHEFGHALTARRFGVLTRDIILSPIGGIARLDKLPEKPSQELLVAIAGPLVNIAIALILSPYFFFISLESLFSSIEATDFINFATFIPTLILLNISLAAFNLLPAFPMDGGRVLRALLSLKMSRLRATRIASFVGQFFAVILVVLGVWKLDSLIMVFIGIFIFLMASSEYKMIRLDSILNKFTVSDIYRSQYTRFLLDDPIHIAIETFKRGMEKNFLVFKEESPWPSGVLHEEFLLEAMRKNDLQSAVQEYSSQKFEAAFLQESLHSIYYRMKNRGYSILPVMKEGMLIGVIDIAMINNFLGLQQKIKNRAIFKNPFSVNQH